MFYVRLQIAIIVMNYVVFKGNRNDTLCSLLQFNEENITFDALGSTAAMKFMKNSIEICYWEWENFLDET